MAAHWARAAHGGCTSARAGAEVGRTAAAGGRLLYKTACSWRLHYGNSSPCAVASKLLIQHPTYNSRIDAIYFQAPATSNQQPRALSERDLAVHSELINGTHICVLLQRAALVLLGRRGRRTPPRAAAGGAALQCRSPAASNVAARAGRAASMAAAGPQKLLCVGDSHTEAIAGTDWVGALAAATSGKLRVVREGRGAPSCAAWPAPRSRTPAVLSARGCTVAACLHAWLGRERRAPFAALPQARATPTPMRVRTVFTRAPGGQWAVLIRRRLEGLIDAHPDARGVVILAGTNDVIASLGEGAGRPSRRLGSARRRRTAPPRAQLPASATFPFHPSPAAWTATRHRPRPP